MKIKNEWLGIRLALLLVWGTMSLGAQAQTSTQAEPLGPQASSAVAASVPSAKPQFHIKPVAPGWQESLPRSAEAATQAYLDRLPTEVVARANAYFEGGYWLQLWNFLLGLLIAGLMLQGRRSARVRDWAARVTRKKAFARDALFGAAYALAAGVLTLPLSIYQGFVREHAYGMATQNFAAWAGEQLIGLAVSMVLTGLAVALLYAVIRRSGDRWWLWGAATGTGLMALLIMAGPVFIEPLFNTYRPVEDGSVKRSVLSMAKANGVPADNVYQFDASRQTTRVSANVSGLFGTAAVRLNDNLLRRCTEPEIRAVMGHELGHYVLNHVGKMLVEMALLLLAGFLFAQWAMNRFLQRRGAGWGLQSGSAGMGDVASLPLLVAVFSVFMFLATPIFNTIVRVQEQEADYHGLNLAREPHGMAEAMLKLVEYRKPDPTPLEEFVFFDHPSARTRIHASMRWREAMGTP
ncbi:M48 family metallopeptidase [Paucibacter sp. Y2R2-4]|uniref:M48 family metallopeptidase n=1 Tax=Paucibacter sp. Y2R2-4 TaxID=2893553 RepID=UPI0021E51425|nr:M48 family metallopeptidase [Paucibacter sp. Y2R2-4]MCV2350924.1 M48 family metallopeptidase [Paucibacter sp. Y2R2-4]